MQSSNFEIKFEPLALLKNMESEYKYLNAKENKERTTKIEYYEYVDEDDIINYVPVVRYKIFDDYKDVTVGFSTRFGGVSHEHLFSMNLSFSRGDEPDNVIENHKRFSKAVGYEYTKLVFSDQVHETVIKVIDEKDSGKGILKKSDIIGVDGLVTNILNIPLITFYADCVPLYFYDPIKKVVGLAHSGWRGTVKNIAANMIHKMKDIYGCNSSDIVCAIGPSICQDCYEVSDEVMNEVRKKYSHAEIMDSVIDKKNGKYQLDLHKLCKYNLINCGVLEKNIAMPDLCTCCNSGLFFSHRATNGKRGNNAAVIMLK